MHGPQPRAPDYENVCKTAQGIPIRLDNSVPDVLRKAQVSSATVEWLTLARNEFTTLAGDDLSFKETHFAKRSAVSAIAAPWGAASAVSAVWRGLAKRAYEVSASMARPSMDEAQTKIVHMHVRAIAKANELVPKSARPELSKHF